jgi:predicted component of type VI protein secretion system
LVKKYGLGREGGDDGEELLEVITKLTKLFEYLPREQLSACIELILEAEKVGSQRTEDS